MPTERHCRFVTILDVVLIQFPNLGQACLLSCRIQDKGQLRREPRCQSQPIGYVLFLHRSFSC